MAEHVAHLFIRDPLAVYKGQLDIGDEDETDHFENINSTNWQTVRFKPPPPGSDIGWRVEMRPIEVSLCFINHMDLLVNIIMLLPLNKVLFLYLPCFSGLEDGEVISKENPLTKVHLFEIDIVYFNFVENHRVSVKKHCYLQRLRQSNFAKLLYSPKLSIFLE